MQRLQLMANKLIVIDGNALVHRAWHALPPLQTKSGQLVNAVYGFLLVFFKVLKDIKPTHCVVAFDLKGPTFRHEAFEAYKATRVKQPDELYEQIPILKKVLAALRVPVVEAQGYEADDVIGTIASRAEQAQLSTVIVTGDLDTLQLVSDHVAVCTLKKGLSDTIIYDAVAVKARYGLPPQALVEYRALRGDPSDNIPGVKGIGEKTAALLIQKYGTIAKLYQALERSNKVTTPLTPRLRELLLAHKAEAMMSRQLSEIVREVPISISLDDFVRRDPDEATLVPLLQSLEFKSLLSKLPVKTEASHGQQPSEPARASKDKHAYRLVDDDAGFKKFISKLQSQPCFVFDTETTGLNPFTVDLLGISFCWKSREAYYVVTDSHPQRLENLRPIFADAAIKKWGHNTKYDIEVLNHAGLSVAGVEGDTMIASYLLNPGSRAHDLDTLAFIEFGHRMIPITKLIGEPSRRKVGTPTLEGASGQKSMRDVPVADAAEYSGEDADYTWRLKEKLLPELKSQGLRRLFDEVEMPLVPVIVAMETAGIKVDPRVLERAKSVASKRLSVLEKKIHKLASQPFNVASPQQLKVILFEKLKLSSEGIAKTKTGLSTAAMELEKIEGQHPIISLILEHRELAKLISTYLEALPLLMDPVTHRIHTSFNQTVTATGRLSSSEPNLQNIPVRTEASQHVRRAFVAERGMTFLSADYSQIELRIVASLANDTAMLDIFRRGEDIHRATAAAIHGVSPDQVTPAMRYAAKGVNFGVIYGMGAWGLAARTKLDPAAAREFIAKYFQTFGGVKAYLEQTKITTKELGYVETLFGRRRYLPEINSGVAQVRAAAERMAINMPVQGTAADLMKLAMIQVYQGLSQVSPKAKLVLQVHDELVLEVPLQEVDAVGHFVKETMEQIAHLQAPIEVHLKAGQSWGTMKPLKS